MKQETSQRPKIKEFLGDISIEQAAGIYHRAEPLFKYAQALDNYIDSLEQNGLPKELREWTEHQLKKEIEMENEWIKHFPRGNENRACHCLIKEKLESFLNELTPTEHGK